MPLSPNARCSTIAEAICNLRRNQLDELAAEIAARDSDWGAALGKRLTGELPLRVQERAASDLDFEVKDEPPVNDPQEDPFDG